MRSPCSSGNPPIKTRSDLFCIMLRDGHIVGSSFAWQALLGYPPESYRALKLQNLLTPGQDHCWSRILAKLQTHNATSLLLRCEAANGRILYLLGHFTPATPALQGAIRATFQDISISYQAKLLTRQSFRMVRQMATQTNGAMVMFCDSGRVCHWSPEAEALFGYRSKDILRRDIRSAIPLCHDLAAPQTTAISGHPPPCPDLALDPREVTCRCKDGTQVTVDLSLASFATHKRRYTIGLCYDRQRHTAQDRHIQQLAYYDPLTELPNRVLLQERLDQSLAEALRSHHPLAVLFVDLDRFKQVNDSLGHAIGDQLLKMVGQRLQQCLRSNDTVARLGGDEFIIVLSGFRHPSSLPKILDKIFDALSKPYRIEMHRIVVTASIGVAVCPDDGTAADLLMRNADIAMYVAKEERGNSYQLFCQEMNQALKNQLALETHLRQAVDNGEFFLLFQPRFHLASEKVVSIECFLRWKRPDGNILSPKAFLPRLEEMGLMASLGNRILRKACAFGASLQQAGMPHIPVAINLSCSQFRQRNLHESIATILQETGLPANCLELEINECTLQKNEERAEEILRSIKRLGVSWSLDNFGLGYTSLQRLKTLPFDNLKIDRHFIRNLPETQTDAAMVGAILAMARNLGLVTIAEGIETFAQHHLLLAMGCHYGQGFLFREPCRRGELQTFLQREIGPIQPAFPTIAPPFTDSDCKAPENTRATSAGPVH